MNEEKESIDEYEEKESIHEWRKESIDELFRGRSESINIYKLPINLCSHCGQKLPEKKHNLSVLINPYSYRTPSFQEFTNVSESKIHKIFCLI